MEPGSFPQVQGLIIDTVWDPVLFPEPHVLRPERHLDADGNFVKNDNITPFGVGECCRGVMGLRARTHTHTHTHVHTHTVILLIDKLMHDKKVGHTHTHTHTCTHT